VPLNSLTAAQACRHEYPSHNKIDFRVDSAGRNIPVIVRVEPIARYSPRAVADSGNKFIARQYSRAWYTIGLIFQKSFTYNNQSVSGGAQ